MTKPKGGRAKPCQEASLEEDDVATIKRLLMVWPKLRQSDIAGIFKCHPGRVSEINTGQRFVDVLPCSYGLALRVVLSRLFPRE